MIIFPLSTPGVLQWLHHLDPQHLRVEVGLEEHRATFIARNWQDIPGFAVEAAEAFDGYIILYLCPSGAELPTVTGLYLVDKEWCIIRPNYLRHFIPSDEKANFAGIYDIYQDCPVPITSHFPE